MNKKVGVMIILIIILVLFFQGCAPSEIAIQKSIAQTQTALPASTSTPTTIPTSTPTPELTLEQKELINELEQRIAAIDREIASATKENAEYAGGLIKTYIELRIEILKTTKALYQNHIQTIELGVQSPILLNVTEPDQNKAATLAIDIENQKKRVADARSEASKYSGGLVYALSLTTLATDQFTLALLEYQYYLEKYGTYFYEVPTLPTAVP